METVLSFAGVAKRFSSPDGPVTALDAIDFALAPGSRCALLGPSGSGKTTLLSLAAGLDDPTSGRIALLGSDWAGLNEEERARVRREKTGFVFQSFQLMGTLNALENVMVPLELMRRRQARETAREVLDRVGLSHRLSHYPSQLSGGEQQRVAIARAFANRPEILFADEPTGNLDAENASRIVNLLFELNREHQTTLLLVTHDRDLAGRCQRTLELKGGRLIADSQHAATGNGP